MHTNCNLWGIGELSNLTPSDMMTATHWCPPRWAPGNGGWSDGFAGWVRSFFCRHCLLHSDAPARHVRLIRSPPPHLLDRGLTLTTLRDSAFLPSPSPPLLTDAAHHTTARLRTFLHTHLPRPPPLLLGLSPLERISSGVGVARHLSRLPRLPHTSVEGSCLYLTFSNLGNDCT